VPHSRDMGHPLNLPKGRFFIANFIEILIFLEIYEVNDSIKSMLVGKDDRMEKNEVHQK
jgi:hypothetical protein